MPLGTPFFHSQRSFQRSRARIPEILRHSADGCREGFILYVVGLPTLYLRYARDHEKEKKRSCWPQYDFPVSRRGKGPRFNFHPHPDLYNTQSSASNNFYTQSSRLSIQLNSFSRIGTTIWNEMPLTLRNLSKYDFKRKIERVLFDILTSEDSYLGLRNIIQKVKFS